MRLILLAMAVMFLLSSCVTVQDTGKAVSGAAVIDSAIMSGEVLDTILTVELSAADMAVVEDIYDYYMRFRESWSEHPERIVSEPFAFEQFKKDYRILVGKYENLKGVVERNADRYNPIRLGVLRDYDRMATMSYVATNNLIESGDRNQTLNSALEFGTIMGRMVILLL